MIDIHVLFSLLILFDHQKKNPFGSGITKGVQILFDYLNSGNT